ncbi:MAG: AEC family transporter [Thermoleophilaceae bacterium]|nr:AEC family transporter [Thermoleophilaceae bacterium]
MIWIAIVMAVATTVGVYSSKYRPARADWAARRVLDVVLWVMIPIVIFFNLTRFEFTATIGAAFGIAYLGNFLVIGLAYAIGTYALKLSRKTVGTIMCCALMGNTAYLGYPFVSTVLGFDALADAVPYDTIVGVPSLLLIGFSIGAAFGTIAERPRDRIRSFFTRNPVLYAAIAALLAPDNFAPDWSIHFTRILVISILPLGFFAVGVTLAHEAEVDSLPFPPPFTAPVATAVFLKLAVVPVILLLAGWLVVDIPPAFVLQAAMPVGVNNLLIANNYGLDRQLAASAIVWSTPLVLLLGLAIELF